MLYIINDICYVNISPLIYVEVTISKDGKITPTKNKIEVGSNTTVEKVTLKEAMQRFIKIEVPKEEQKINQKHNRRKR